MRINILGVTIDTYSMAETVEKIRQAVEDHVQMRVVTANPEMIYASNYDQKLRRVINSADIVTADGIGVVWAARKLGSPVKERVTGIDLIQALFPVANKGRWRFFFLGGKPGVAEKAAERIAREYPKISLEGMHGYFNAQEEPLILKKIERFHPDVLLVGMGAPRQEYWLGEHPLLATISMGVGGSFDVLSGTAIRAPQYIQELHAEWLYRLWKEPKRWRRQSILPRFVVKVFLQKLGFDFTREMIF